MYDEAVDKFEKKNYGKMKEVEIELKKLERLGHKMTGRLFKQEGKVEVYGIFLLVSGFIEISYCNQFSIPKLGRKKMILNLLKNAKVCWA